MPDSKRETALKALLSLLQGLDFGELEPDIQRNAPEQIKPTSRGLIVMRDGSPGEPDVSLSPVTYYYTHAAEIMVIISDPTESVRDERLDAALQVIGAAVLADDTLGGTVDYCRAGAVDPIDDAVEGGAPIKAGLFQVLMDYNTASPLL